MIIKTVPKATPPGLAVLTAQVKRLVKRQKYGAAAALIVAAMQAYPHAPHPHNLMGALMEAQGDNAAAMKHYRAAWALDPGYEPARYNLDRFASFEEKAHAAFSENDCTPG